MPVLIVNAGSTSVKYKLFDRDSEELLVGIIEAERNGFVSRTYENGNKYTRRINEEEFRNSSSLIIEETIGYCIERIGFRMVHGGELFTEPIRITDAVADSLDELGRLAPLHNPPVVENIRGFRKLLSDIPQYAVFDTAFHSTLPAEAFLYSIPYKLYERHAIRKYGFHGISHQYVSERLKALVHNANRKIICHLGGGASITAVRDGRSIETSMGFTPLQGLTMATRSGDLDVGVVFHLVEHLGLSLSRVKEILNNKSGLLGLSKQTSDMRILLEKELAGDKQAALATAVYVHGIQRYIGAYAAILGGVDVVAFTGGIGTGSAVIRNRVCSRLGYLGVEVEDAVNDGLSGTFEEQKISAAGSLPVWVIPSNEELQIFREISKLEG